MTQIAGKERKLPMTELTTQPSHEMDRLSLIEAMQRVKPDLIAFPKKERVHINQNIPSVVIRILGKLPGLRAFRPQLAELKGFDIDCFDKLEEYALALSHA